MSKARKTVYGILLFASLLLLFFHYGLIRPLQQHVLMQEAEHEAVTADFQRIQAQLAEKYGQNDQQRLEELMETLPVTPEVSQIIRDMESLERETGLLMESITFSTELVRDDEENRLHFMEMLRNGFSFADGKPVPEQIPLPSVNFTVKFASSLQQFRDFLSRVEKLPRIIIVESFDFASDDPARAANSGQAGQMINGTVTLRAVYAEQFQPYVR
jgi:Tfp pilus assembly protein PilO